MTISQDIDTGESQPLLKNQQNQQNSESLKDLKGYVKPLISAFFISIVAGINDGSLGSIIPRIKSYYQITNETVSILFLCSAFGFFLSGAFNGYIVYKLGQLKTLFLGSTMMFISFSLLSMGLPFPFMACTMPFVGGGMALLDGAMNVYTANVPLATLMLNVLHAIYGVGAMISPLVASFLLKHDISWKGMYFFLAVVGFVNIASIAFGFWHVDFEDAKHIGQEEVVVVEDPLSASPRGDTGSQHQQQQQQQQPVELKHSELTKKAIFNRVTIISAAYILIYVGVEVTMGGWAYTFLKEGRHGDEVIMANVVSGYWAGLAAGRILLGYLSNRFGEKLTIMIFTMTIIICLVTMMVSTDIVFDSTALIAIGFLLGPMFPTTISLMSKALPRNYHATAIGFVAALGAGGAALFPFMTGQIAGKFGILIVPFVCVFMTTAMAVLWVFIPSKRPLLAAFRHSGYESV